MMRELLDKLSIIVESTGLANRKSGDLFKNSQGDVLSFVSLDLFPEEGGKLDTEQLNDLITKLGSDVKWQGKKPKTGGVAIATFDSEKGPVKYGFFKQQIYPNKTENVLKNEFDGYKFDSKVAAKEQSNLSPTDLLSQLEDLSAEDIISQLNQNESLAPELKQLAELVAAGGPYPIKVPKPEGVSFTGIRDYFCEILQPIALQTGQFKGNAGEAAERFMGGSFADALITFPTAKNNGLADSLLTKSDGKYVKISSKGGSGGASASVKNLIDAFNEIKLSPEGSKLADKYKDEIELIDNINKQGQSLAPIYLGKKFGIIDDEDATTMLNLRRQRPVNLDDIDSLPLSDNLKQLAKGRSTKTPQSTNLWYHILAAVADKAAEKVNETNFGEAASDILNNGALIQVYSDKALKEQGDELVLNEFVTKYPGQSVRGVSFEAGKTYYSTGINGNFTFKIDRGEGKGKETTQTPEPETNKLAPLSDISKSIIEPRLLRPKTASAPASGTGPAGREKRK